MDRTERLQEIKDYLHGVGDGRKHLFSTPEGVVEIRRGEQSWHHKWLELEEWPLDEVVSEETRV